jgi:CMP-N-acetylneuraminic acid synthetase
MPDPARTLVVIPARGGSKRLPRKNVLPLGGKPLILHAVDVALTAAPFGRVLVSTDDAEIKAVTASRPGVTVDDRADILAGDKVKVVDVIGELLDRNEIQRNFDVIGMMLPTCPFRTASQAQEAFDALTPDFDATITFSTYEFPPQASVTLDDKGTMIPLFDPSPLITGNTRSQDQAPAYRPNGAFFFTWVESFRRLRSFYTGKVRGIVMPRINSVDIDDGHDFAYAQFLIDSGRIVVPT